MEEFRHKPLFTMFGCPLIVSVGGFTHNPVLLSVSEFKMAGSDLAETEGASRKPTKPIEFSPQVTHFFNIIGYLEIFRRFMGFLEVKQEIFRTFLEKFRKDF